MDTPVIIDEFQVIRDDKTYSVMIYESGKVILLDDDWSPDNIGVKIFSSIEEFNVHNSSYGNISCNFSYKVQNNDNAFYHIYSNFASIITAFVTYNTSLLLIHIADFV